MIEILHDKSLIMYRDRNPAAAAGGRRRPPEASSSESASDSARDSEFTATEPEPQAGSVASELISVQDKTHDGGLIWRHGTSTCTYSSSSTSWATVCQ